LYTGLGQHSFIRDKVVESAELRVRAVEAARGFFGAFACFPLLTSLLDVMALYGPVDLVKELQNRNEEMKNVVRRMKEMEQRMNDMEQAMKDIQAMKDLAKDVTNAPS
jgi:hypothetical protein